MNQKSTKSSLFNIHPFHFKELLKNRLSLDHIYYLELIEEEIDVAYLLSDNSGENWGLSQFLERKGYISEGKLSLKGKDLLSFVRDEPQGMNNMELHVRKNSRISSEDLDRVWNAYPATDNIVRDGKILYKGTRALRKAKGGKDAIRGKLSQILAEGKYTCDDIIRAIAFEVEQKIDESIKRKENKLSWMQNIDSYINQRTFEAYVEVSRLSSTETEKHPTSFITDI